MKGVIFDVDGVLTFQGRTIPGAVETINLLREKGIVLRFLTNSTLKSRLSCAFKLQKAGFCITKEEVITASYATAVYLRKIKPKSCWVLLEREGFNEFKDFNYNDENPEYVVVGDYRDGFNFTNMNKALKLLLKGAKLIGMSPELIDSSMGDYELNVGSWAKMLERASGVEAVYIGKPSSYMFELVLESMELRKGEVVMVGDKVSTDIVGAHNVGITTILVKTGEFTEKDLENEVTPDFICNSVADSVDILDAEGWFR
ncbi:MAG: HAD-IIA family hydrolase [Theionarchaea archaeon]|nr:MAG: hypothetical protein AYK18_11970 [Theionarchaea archaeon DG-70]MBU7010157.1 HAD-IIA family hydrolase [Theionarchaea archaeon]